MSISSKSVREGQFIYEAAALSSRATLTVTRPGVVKVVTQGDQHVVIDHVSYYIDITAHLYGDATTKLERAHIVYRFGDLQERPTPDQVESVTTMVTQWLTELVESCGAEVGVVGDDEDDEADRFRLANLKRDLVNTRTAIKNLTARLEDGQLRLSELRQTEATASAVIEEITARIEARRTAAA